MPTPLMMPIKVFDFFAGCGGSSAGFREAGLELVFALDNDPDAKETFEANLPGVHYESTEIETFTVQKLQPYVDRCYGHPILFCGCAPCQPFTKQNTKPKDKSAKSVLLDHFRRFVEHFEPELIFIENVPGMQRVQEKAGPFHDFIEALEQHDYLYKVDILAARDYGVPQRRRRLVLIASRLGQVSFPPRTHGPGTPNTNFATVEEWIGYLPPIQAGEVSPEDPIHRAAKLSDLNLQRIRALSVGESRSAWPDELKLACHTKVQDGRTEVYEGHTDVYGRMKWNEPASGLTTRCISLSNGRFGHPEQNRAISVREAARLQTFPKDFILKGSYSSMARQIGNAVPVLLAQRFGEHFNAHVRQYLGEA